MKNQINATFSPDTVQWLHQLARERYHTQTRGSATLAVRVCVDLVRQFGFAELESLLAKRENEQSIHNQPVSNTG